MGVEQVRIIQLNCLTRRHKSMLKYKFYYDHQNYKALSFFSTLILFSLVPDKESF